MMPTQNFPWMADDYASHILLAIILLSQFDNWNQLVRLGWEWLFTIHYVPLTTPTQSLFDVLEAEPRKRSYAFGEKGRPIRWQSRSARPHSARSVLKVEVPRYYLRGSGLNSYHIFEVKVSWCKVYRETAKQNYSWCYTVCTTIFCLMQIQLGNHRWSVYRRYSEFQQFHEEMKENYPQVCTAVNVNLF